MKGPSYTLPAKRRWKGLVIAVVGLVLLSMLVTLVFLLGLHNGFHSVAGDTTVQQTSASVRTWKNDLTAYDQHDDSNTWNYSESEQDKSTRVDELIRVSRPTFSKDFRGNSTEDAENGTIGFPVPTDVPKPRPKTEFRGNSVEDAENETIGFSAPADVPKPRPKTDKTKADGTVEGAKIMKSVYDDENLCEEKFGSYCLWRQEHREKMKDYIVKKMKDQLYVARAYYPSIAKLPAHDKLSRELKQNIQEFERVLSETTTDTDLPPQIEKKLRKMEDVITRAKSFVVDCNNVDKKLRQLVDLTEDEANFHMKQSVFLYQLAAQTMPKSLHCLSMRLTVEYFRSPLLDMKQTFAEKYMNPELHHYVLFSNNVLASSVVINSTVMHAELSGNQVFHVLTDGQSYFSMKLWFYKNSYKEAAVQVLNIEDLDLKEHDNATLFNLSMPEEFHVSFRGIDKHSTTQFRTEYISIFSHSHYLLPKIFKTLKKVVVLDDDIVVQQDLSALWNLDMEGKVNGAVQSCKLRLDQLKFFLGENSYDGKSCVWMSGLNIVDLIRWREQDLTETFQRFVKQLSTRNGFVEDVTLHASLLTFQGLVYALDDAWVLSGLGHNYGLDMQAIKKAAVLHFNGNMKPWLELAIPKYRGYWRKFLNREDQVLSDCNIIP